MTLVLRYMGVGLLLSVEVFNVLVTLDSPYSRGAVNTKTVVAVPIPVY